MQRRPVAPAMRQPQRQGFWCPLPKLWLFLKCSRDDLFKKMQKNSRQYLFKNFSDSESLWRNLSYIFHDIKLYLDGSKITSKCFISFIRIQSSCSCKEDGCVQISNNAGDGICSIFQGMSSSAGRVQCRQNKRALKYLKSSL